MTKVINFKDQDRKWYLIDAKGQILGRLSTQIADLLRGKGKVSYSPNMDCGDNVIIINASKIKVSTTAKLENKTYFHHTGYPGGIKKETLQERLEKSPEKVILESVRGMLQKNKLAKDQIVRLRVYAGAEHPHTQELIEIAISEKK